MSPFLNMELKNRMRSIWTCSHGEPPIGPFSSAALQIKQLLRNWSTLVTRCRCADSTSCAVLSVRCCSRRCSVSTSNTPRLIFKPYLRGVTSCLCSASHGGSQTAAGEHEHDSICIMRSDFLLVGQGFIRRPLKGFRGGPCLFRSDCRKISYVYIPESEMCVWLCSSTKKDIHSCDGIFLGDQDEEAWGTSPLPLCWMKTPSLMPLSLAP